MYTKTDFELSPYRLMWMLVLFDLPVTEVEERKNATKFRNFLLDNGFQMVQFSVYTRLLSGKDSANTHIKQIERNLPENGKVEIICITDKQYQNILSFDSYQKTKKKSPLEQPLLF